MSTLSRSVALASAALVLALACGQERPEPLPYGAGGATSNGGTRSSGGTKSSGGSSEGGESGDGSAGAGEGGESSGGANGSSGGAAGAEGETGGTAGADPGIEIDPCPSEDTGGTPPDSSAICSLSAGWSEGAAFSAGDEGNSQLLGITPDELTVLWFSATGSTGSTLFADRVNTNVDFDEPQTIDARNVSALSPDGLRVVTIADELDAFFELTRAARGEPFGSPAEGAFSAINADAAEHGFLLGNVVLSPDDRTLYYTVSAFPAEEYPVRVSTRSDDGPWPVGEPLEACELKGYGAVERQPTAISADGLTLFYYDSISGAPRAAWRESADGAFVWSVALDERFGARPNQACDRLYYSGASGLLVADAE